MAILSCTFENGIETESTPRYVLERNPLRAPELLHLTTRRAFFLCEETVCADAVHKCVHRSDC